MDMEESVDPDDGISLLDNIFFICCLRNQSSEFFRVRVLKLSSPAIEPELLEAPMVLLSPLTVLWSPLIVDASPVVVLPTSVVDLQIKQSI